MTELKKILKKTIKENEKTTKDGYFESLDYESKRIYLAGMNKGIINTCKGVLKRIEKTKPTKTQKKKLTKNKKFTKPTIEEITAYCQERKNNVNPEMFRDHYEARDWILNNRQKMKDWKAAVRTWEGRNFSTNAKKRIEPTPEWLKNESGPIVIEKPEDAAKAVERIRKMKEEFRAK